MKALQDDLLDDDSGRLLPAPAEREMGRRCNTSRLPPPSPIKQSPDGRIRGRVLHRDFHRIGVGNFELLSPCLAFLFLEAHGSTGSGATHACGI